MQLSLLKKNLKNRFHFCGGRFVSVSPAGRVQVQGLVGLVVPEAGTFT